MSYVHYPSLNGIILLEDILYYMSLNEIIIDILSSYGSWLSSFPFVGKISLYWRLKQKLTTVSRRHVKCTHSKITVYVHYIIIQNVVPWDSNNSNYNVYVNITAILESVKDLEITYSFLMLPWKVAGLICKSRCYDHHALHYQRDKEDR